MPHTMDAVLLHMSDQSKQSVKLSQYMDAIFWKPTGNDLDESL